MTKGRKSWKSGGTRSFIASCVLLHFVLFSFESVETPALPALRSRVARWQPCWADFSLIPLYVLFCDITVLSRRLSPLTFPLTFLFWLRYYPVFWSA
ncbi:hypothetical protein BJX96DRAFT_36031 [Aspergillus floccosus]